MLEHAYAVILAGGKGERFWPLSTARNPKQFLSLVGGTPLIRQAVERLEGLIPPARVIVITAADLVDATRAALPELPVQNVVGEPFGRDTAAACALALALVQAREDGASFCILTADQVIQDLDLFRATLREGFDAAQAADVLITIGIRPASPSTAFGYIEAADSYPHAGRIEFRKARRFVEKPEARIAAEYVASGTFFWNAGMFIWSCESLRRALRAHRPELLAMAVRMGPHIGAQSFDARLREEYGTLEKISVDYAIMEKAGNIVMAVGAFRWDDVGSWPALANHLEPDGDGNVVVGDCEAVESSGNIVVSGGRLTALVGVRDLVVVQAAGATLVCHKDRAQDVKAIVARLRQRSDGQSLL